MTACLLRSKGETRGRLFDQRWQKSVSSPQILELPRFGESWHESELI
jgi:hypothetical protein